MVLLWLVIFPAVYAGCSRDLEQQRTREIIQKLCRLGDMRPVGCKSEAENMNIHYPNFPKKMNRELWEMSFQFAYDLFKKDQTLTKWDSRELRHLRELLGQQANQTCIQLHAANTAAKKVVSEWKTFWISLENYLSQKNFSSCAWESARTLIQQVMRIIYTHTKKSQRPIRSC